MIERVTTPSARFVELADLAIAEARAVRAGFEADGNQVKVEQCDRAISFLEARRDAATEGTLFGTDSGAALGVSRLVGDFEWGPRGDSFVRAAYDLERHWSTEM